MRGPNERHKVFGRGLLVFLGATISVVLTYSVTLKDSADVPAPSTCEPYKDDKYTQASPVPKYRLAYNEKVNGVHPVVERSPAGGVGGKDKEFPHYTAAVAPVCKE